MTEKEYDDLEEGNLIHYIDDDPATNPEDYNWRIMHITHEGMMIENDKNDPVYMEKYEILRDMDVSRPTEKIPAWKLTVSRDSPDAWDGNVTVTLNRSELNILANALLCAEDGDVITREERKKLLDKLNIDDNL